MVDKTEAPITRLYNFNRALSNTSRSEVKKVLPEWFREANPKLISLFESYYKWMYSQEDLNYYDLRNISKAREAFLKYIEDEVLAGQGYFDGFDDLRTALKFSNLFFKSKGTEQSIKLFFKGFYNEEVEVSYPRENLLITQKSINNDNTLVPFTYTPENINLMANEVLRAAVGDSDGIFSEVINSINPDTTYKYGDINNSGRITAFDALQLLYYSVGTLTDATYISRIEDLLDEPRVLKYFQGNLYDELGTPLGSSYTCNNGKYQQNSIEITTELSPNIWLETYKLLIHPAGMFLSVNGVNVNLSGIDDGSLLSSTALKILGPKIYPLGDLEDPSANPFVIFG